MGWQMQEHHAQGSLGKVIDQWQSYTVNPPPPPEKGGEGGGRRLDRVSLGEAKRDDQIKVGT